MSAHAWDSGRKDVYKRQNLDSYDLLEDISDPGRIAAELLRRGKQIEIPEVLYPMLDFERIRDSYFADHKGDYCPSGLVLKLSLIHI